MPRPDFFRNLGLFVVDDFLEPGLCVQLCAEMAGATSKQGNIVLVSGEKIIDENRREVLSAKVRGPSEQHLRERIRALRPSLQKHFGVSLADSESPEFLIYNRGGFYGPYSDGSRE